MKRCLMLIAVAILGLTLAIGAGCMGLRGEETLVWLVVAAVVLALAALLESLFKLVEWLC